jgi:4-amino-4-deoxy-L-arabinose transferase-like glycosyltransferase
MEPTPMRLADLDRAARRRALLRTGLTIVAALALLLAALYLLPFNHFSSGGSVLRLGAVIALVAAVFILQVQRISKAELPELRAVEALGIVIGVFLVGFSVIYLSMSRHNMHTFTQPLDPTQALYFTISVFSTVGFGDITPRTDPARLVVSAQMLLDLAIIGIVVRMIFTAARSRIAPRDEGGRESRPAPAE